MSHPEPLAALFWPHLAPELRLTAEPPAQLEPALTALWQRACDPWPTLSLPMPGFLQHAAQRLSGTGDVVSQLETLHAGDLYLAYGCALGERAAIEAFDRTCISQVAAYLGRRDALAAFTDEIKQQLRARLLVADSGLLPRIAAYSGRGPLGAWLRVAAARLAISLRVAESGTVPLLENDVVVSTAADDPELAYLRARYAPALREAIKSALVALEPREATVLRMFFLESMTHAAIGAVLRLSERTVRRSVSEARQRILELTRTRLAETLDLSAPELDTIIRLARSELAPSIVLLLGDSER